VTAAPEGAVAEAECPHSIFGPPLPKADCPICRMTPAEIKETLPKASKPRVAKPKRLVDPIAKGLQEYLSGYRCWDCDTLRDEKGLCRCETERLFARKAADIERFERQNGDPTDRKLRFVHGAAASGRRRSTLQAGLRDMPATDRLTVGQQVSLSARVENGTVMEWKQGRPSGDELPL
jgi:hypothetical protein